VAPFRVGLTKDFAPGGRLEGVLDRELVQMLDGVPDLSYEFLTEYKPVVSADQVSDFDFVITGPSLWTEGSFRGLTRLAGVAYWGVGYDNIDVAAATESDVIVSITTPAVRRPMAESALAFMLALSKNMLIKDRLTREGRSDKKAQYNGILIRDRVVGCIGLGNIGADFVRLLKPLDPVRILVADPYLNRERAVDAGVELVDLAGLLRDSDFVVVLCPLNDETNGMLGSEQFRLMKKSAFLINVARGKIIKQAELTRALQEGWIKGAALDVFEDEPPDPEDPILKLDNVIVTAHCIGWTEEAFRDNSVEDCRAAVSIYHGVPPAYTVNPAVLDRPRFREKLAAYAERGKS